MGGYVCFILGGEEDKLFLVLERKKEGKAVAFKQMGWMAALLAVSKVSEMTKEW